MNGNFYSQMMTDIYRLLAITQIYEQELQALTDLPKLQLIEVEYPVINDCSVMRIIATAKQFDCKGIYFSITNPKLHTSMMVACALYGLDIVQVTDNFELKVLHRHEKDKEKNDKTTFGVHS